MRVLVVGSGTVAKALAQAWRDAGLEVERRASRGTWESLPPFDVVLLAVADRAIAQTARRAVESGAAGPDTVLLHGAGALAPSEVLATAGVVRGRGLCHPLLAIAGAESPRFAGVTFAVAGDRVGRETAVELARRAGGDVMILEEAALVRYHAAAVLVGNHAFALVAAGMSLLQEVGVAPNEASQALATLWQSAVDNWRRLGLPQALTGPIARGDAVVVARHLACLDESQAEIYRVTGRALIELARLKGQTSAEALAQLETLLGVAPARRDG